MVELLLLVGLAGAAEPQGWRFDGSGAWPTADAPDAWSRTEHVAWRTELGGWSNASPVVAGDLVCACVEPVTLVCLDRATGVERWRATHPIAEAVPEAQRADVQARIAELDALDAELASKRAAYSAMLRDARRGGADLTARVDALATELDALKARIAAVPDFRTPPDQGMVGWSSPTPVTDGRSLYVLYANGVVAAHEHDGTLRWSRWLGRPPELMLGWDEGHAASPVLAGDVLVVPMGHLHGLDPRTGASLWEGESWPHYGAATPAVVDGVPLVLTPSGRAYRAKDGVVLREGMAEMWYVAPVVRDRDVWFLEARADDILRKQHGADLVAWHLDGVQGDRLQATERWRVRVPETETFYAAPVPAGDVLHLVSHEGRLWTVEAASGAILGSLLLDAIRPTALYASPAVAAGHLYVTSERGQTAVLRAGRTPEVVAVNLLENMRASPAFADGRLYFRTELALVAVE
ncbi:MAG: PQQ-binding-like beta-propeller repeat protein [Alphaproteobacteria bacterium]|nr:PQQ-binding-like beta-propeller repeat protein [Alphaproteobacteria bacterium]